MKRLNAAIALMIVAAGLAPHNRMTPAAIAFGQDTPDDLRISGGKITIQVTPGALKPNREQIKTWVSRAATAVSAYYGHFPVERATIKVMPFIGNGFGFATTDSEDDRGMIVIPIGNATTQAKLDSDWVLTHEMVHLAFPLVYPRHRWLVEGMATYIEPIGRMQAGYISKEKMWSDLVNDLPKGLPAEGDGGLNERNSWGRVYWGGALFCVMADLEIRKATHNKKGLQDVLRAVDSTEGDITSGMEVEDALIVADRAIEPKSRVLRDLFQKMSTRPYAPDLNKIWQDLGVKKAGKSVTFDDNAPLAATRKAIEAGPAH